MDFRIEKRLIAAAIAAVLSLAGIIVLIALLADPRTYERALTSYIERRLERRVTFTSEEITVWPWLGLRLRDVEVSRRPPVPGSPFLFARALDVHVRVLPLLFRRVVIRGTYTKAIDVTPWWSYSRIFDWEVDVFVAPSLR